MKGRGCVEQILCLKLFIDIARKTKRTLYIVFIDYVKAYNRVNRLKLLDLLDSKGCGSKFLQAVSSSLNGTCALVGDRVINQSIGMRQGGSLSCPLFTFYIDETINAIYSTLDDDWLRNAHTLLLMDDTVLFSTTREKMQQKLHLLKTATDRIGLTMHPNKSRFICINDSDEEPFDVDNVQIAHTDKYISPVSCKPLSLQIEEQVLVLPSQEIEMLLLL